jgi:hypothetical protein
MPPTSTSGSARLLGNHGCYLESGQGGVVICRNPNQNTTAGIWWIEVVQTVTGAVHVTIQNAAGKYLKPFGTNAACVQAAGAAATVWVLAPSPTGTTLKYMMQPTGLKTYMQTEAANYTGGCTASEVWLGTSQSTLPPTNWNGWWQIKGLTLPYIKRRRRPGKHPKKPIKKPLPDPGVC